MGSVHQRHVSESILAIVMAATPGCDTSVGAIYQSATCGSTAHGETETRLCYVAAKVPYGAVCSGTTQYRTCDDGSFRPDFPACEFLHCTVDPPPVQAWDVTEKPPALTNPTTITLPGNYLGTITHALCSGPAYKVYLDNDKDYIVRTTEILTAPVLLYGGRNIHVIGIHIELGATPCQSDGVSGYIPGTIALMTYQTGTTFVEGAYIDLAGRSADCIDPRNFIGGFEALSKNFSETDARGQRDVVIQNSICRGMSGDHNIHGDILQTQGQYELFRSITFENVSADSNCEGIILEPRQGFLLANNVKLRRFDYRQDDRYTPNFDPFDARYYSGGAIMHSAKSLTYDQVYILRTEGPYELYPANSGWIGNTTYIVGDRVVWGGGQIYECIKSGTSAASGGPTGTGNNIADGSVLWNYLGPQGKYLTTRPSCNSGGLFCPAGPAGNRFATPGTGAGTSAWTGINYVSPH